MSFSILKKILFFSLPIFKQRKLDITFFYGPLVVKYAYTGWYGIRILFSFARLNASYNVDFNDTKWLYYNWTFKDIKLKKVNNFTLTRTESL